MPTVKKMPGCIITSLAAATLGLEFLYVLAANRRTENSSEITTLIERS
jgi:hypothetical protein